MRPGGDLEADLGELNRFGTIDSVDLAGGRCTVRCGDVVTGPIRWLAGRSGATRFWSPPTLGEQVLLICPEGDIAGGIALLGIPSDAHPPAGDSEAELVHFADGAVLSYDPGGHVLEAVLPAGATVRIVAPGGVTLEADVRIAGDLLVEGDVRATGDLEVEGAISATEDITAGEISLQQHKHGGVQAGAAKTAVPE